MNRRGSLKDSAEESRQIVLRSFGFYKPKGFGASAGRFARRVPERLPVNAFPRERRNEEETVSAIRREPENQCVLPRGNNAALTDSGDKRNALQTF